MAATGVIVAIIIAIITGVNKSALFRFTLNQIFVWPLNLRLKIVGFIWCLCYGGDGKVSDGYQIHIS